MQRERDKETLQTRRVTLREEDLLRKAMGEEGLPNRRPKRAAKRPHPLVEVMDRAFAQADATAIDVQHGRVRAASALALSSPPKSE